MAHAVCWITWRTAFIFGVIVQLMVVVSFRPVLVAFQSGVSCRAGRCLLIWSRHRSLQQRKTLFERLEVAEFPCYFVHCPTAACTYSLPIDTGSVSSGLSQEHWCFSSAQAEHTGRTPLHYSREQHQYGMTGSNSVIRMQCILPATFSGDMECTLAQHGAFSGLVPLTSPSERVLATKRTLSECG